MEEDTTQGSGRSGGTQDLVWASALDVWDPELPGFGLLEAVRVQGVAEEDTEQALEAVAAGEHNKHHA